MKTNASFKNEALSALRGNWGKAVLLTLLFVLLASAVSGTSVYQSLKMQSFMTENMSGTGSVRQVTAMLSNPEYLAMMRTANGASAGTTLLQILILLPVALGVTNAYRKLLVERDNNLVVNSFHIAFTNYWHKVGGMLLMTVLIFLWSLLFLIPGIIKAYSYSMTPYILEENPELGLSEAIHRSRMMMRGHKFDLLWLQLSFIGWFLICLLTAGIGFLWLSPYYHTAHAAFYEEVKADYALNGGLA